MPEIGDLVATYRLTGVVGGGGMGTVYGAHDERLDRDVALKLLSPQLSEDSTFRARFEREARIAGQLRHPNIVPVYDAGEWQGQLYLAMLLVEGPNLATVIKTEAPLALRRVTDIVSQVASALDAAHARGIVHRDIKPGNILLLEHAAADDGDHVYLADFGLTRSTGGMTRMTRTGTLLGTLDYIAPEQLQGENVDGRADQYALACTAYEMVTSGPPFQRDSDIALISAHLHSPPPALADVRPDLPAAFGAALARAMAKDPQERFATTGAFAQELTRAALESESEKPTVRVAAPTTALAQGVVAGAPVVDRRGGNGRNVAIVLAVVLLVTLIGVGAVLALNNNGPGATPPSSGLIGVATGSPSVSPSALLTSTPIASSSLASTLSPPPSVVSGGTSPPFPWEVSISASASSVPVGQVVTITAVTNADVSSAGYVIEISIQSSSKVVTTCSAGASCMVNAEPVVPRITTYLATVGPPGGPAASQSTTTVEWFAGPSAPPPSSPPPITPTPGVIGPQLASGDWTVVHMLVNEVAGGQDYEEATISRTYTLTNYVCLSASNCTAKFVTNEGVNVIYHWNGSSFVYGPRTYNEGRTCGGTGGSFNIDQTVNVSPVGWDGTSPITHLTGTMTLVGNVTPIGLAAGCTDFELDYSTDISHI